MKSFTDAFGIKHNLDDLYTHIKKQESSICLSFRGLDSFLELFDAKLIIPKLTIIRIDAGNDGKHYLVLNRNELEGATSQAYSGPKGRHNVRNCFEEEAFSLEGVFIPRKYNIRNMNWDIYDETSKEIIELRDHSLDL